MQILGRQMNALIVLLVLGLIAGALVGYATVPVEKAGIRLGPLAIETQAKKPSPGDELTNRQSDHVLMIMLIGGIIGLGCGFLVQRSIRL